MLTFKQLLQKELKHGNQDYLDENRRSLGRFTKHVMNDPFVIVISVERSPYEVGIKHGSKSTDSVSDIRKRGVFWNAVNTLDFRKQLTTHRAGFIKVTGHYVETIDIDDIKQPYDVVEQSSIVYTTERNKDTIWRLCVHWAKKTNQESILVIDHGKAKYYFPDSNTFENVGLFYPDKLGQYYTTLHNNKSFTFTSDRSKISDKLKSVFNYTDDDVAGYTK